MDILTIGEGSYIFSLEGKNYALYRTNIPIRLDSETLVYMVKVECEQSGYFAPIQTQVTFKQLLEGAAQGKSSLKVMVEAILPKVKESWKMDLTSLLGKIG